MNSSLKVAIWAVGIVVILYSAVGLFLSLFVVLPLCYVYISSSSQVSSCLFDHYTNVIVPIVLVLLTILSIRNLRIHTRRSVLFMVGALAILVAVIFYNYFFLHLSSDWLNSLLFGFFYSG